MANNCCPTEFIAGGTIIDATLLRPEIVSGVLTAATLTGGVTLDAPTAKSLADQICADLTSCIQNAVDEGRFTSVTLDEARLTMAELMNTTLSGTITLTDTAAQSLVTALCPLLTDCVIDAVEGNTLTGVTLTNASFDGTITLAEPTVLLLHKALEEAIAAQVVQMLSEALANVAITGGTLNDVTINGSTLMNSTGSDLALTDTHLKGTTTISGEVPLDSEALDHLCAQLTPCVNGMIDAAANPSQIAAVFQDCSGAPRAPGVRLPSCDDMTVAISSAIASLPAVDIISGFTYDDATHTLKLETTLSDGTVQKWEIDLDSIGGQVVADQVTVGGDGTTAKPLRAILTEVTTVRAPTTGTELPTDVYGARTALLGTPDKWVEFGGYILPAWNKP